MGSAIPIATALNKYEIVCRLLLTMSTSRLIMTVDIVDPKEGVSYGFRKKVPTAQTGSEHERSRGGGEGGDGLYAVVQNGA